MRADFGAGEQPLDLPAPMVGNDQDADALAPGPAGAATAMQERLWVFRQIGVDDKFEIGQINAPGRDIGRDADPGPPVPQGLERVGAFVLSQLAG